MDFRFILPLMFLVAVADVGNGDSTSDALTKFFRETIENFRAQMKDGFPEFDVPSLDPFAMEDKELALHDEKANIEGSLKDVTITGLSDFYVKSLTADANKLEAEIELHFTGIRGQGNYKVDGTVFKIFPVSGDGPFWVKADEVSSRGRVLLRENGNYLQIVEANLDLNIEEISGHFDNMLGGGELGEVFNMILNKFGKKILDSYSPSLMKKVIGTFQEHANYELSQIPINELLHGTTTMEPVDSTTDY